VGAAPVSRMAAQGHFTQMRRRFDQFRSGAKLLTRRRSAADRGEYCRAAGAAAVSA
jgi:hypothetical protein